MQRVTQHDNVTVLYEGLLASGEIFESSRDSGPLSFTVGKGEVMPAFEQAVLDMAPGETKTVRVPAPDAYGPKNRELIQTVSRKVFGGRQVAPGMVVSMPLTREGKVHKVPGLVSKVEKNKITVDFNHPLAGQDLTFQITLQAIAGPKPEAAPQHDIDAAA